MKKTISLIVAACMLMGITVFAEESQTPADSKISIEVIDNLLREVNTPESQIQLMDDELKMSVYENSLSKGVVQYVDVSQEECAEPLRASGYAIPTSQLKLSVTAFKVQGKQKVDIYPSYEWLVPVKPKGKDYFGYSTHGSFSAVAGERSNVIYAKLEKNDPWASSGSATYTGTSLTGYQHSGSSLGTPDFSIYLKGHFYYQVDIDSTSPVKKIVLAYVHDTSLGSGLSYGIGYGPLSISITPNSSNVGYQNNIYNLNY